VHTNTSKNLEKGNPDMYLRFTIVAGNLETEKMQLEKQESVKRGMYLLKASGE
jgi:hypothetical protein